MAMELYWGSGSPFAWRVMLALEIKRAPYTARLLEFSKGHLKTPEFLALNPRGKVPVLKNGKVVLAESLAILAYIDREIPQPPLFGQTAEQTGLIWKAICECANYLEPAAERILSPLFSNAVTNPDDVRAAMKEAHAELQGIERRLAAHQWLVTDVVSAADVTVYPWIELLLRAAGKPAASSLDLGLSPLAKTYPAIAAWVDRIKKLPGYDKTYPPHWRG